MPINFNFETPAAPTGAQNVHFVQDGLGGVSAYWDQDRKYGVSISGGGAAIATGASGSIQANAAGTVVGWAITSVGATGSITIAVSSAAGTEALPVVPANTANLSGAYPMSMTGSAAGTGATGVSVWSSTAINQWDTILFYVTAASGVQQATAYIKVQ